MEILIRIKGEGGGKGKKVSDTLWNREKEGLVRMSLRLEGGSENLDQIRGRSQSTGGQFELSWVQSSFNRVQLFAIPWSVACQAPLSMGFFQARILEWIAISFSRGSSWPRDWTLTYPALAGRFFTTSTTWESLTSPVLGQPGLLQVIHLLCSVMTASRP